MLWFFMLVLCAIAAIIISSAIAERPKFSVYLIYSAVVSLINIQSMGTDSGVVDGLAVVIL